MAELRQVKAEEHLQRTADLQAEVMARRGIAAAEIEGHRAAFVAAARVEFARYGRRSDGGAA